MFVNILWNVVRIESYFAKFTFPTCNTVFIHFDPLLHAYNKLLAFFSVFASVFQSPTYTRFPDGLAYCFQFPTTNSTHVFVALFALFRF